MTTSAPFNFLGTMTWTQFLAFESWLQGRESKLPPISTFHQSRATQLRKTSGLLEKFYKDVDTRGLTPSFVKEPWKPVEDGHFTPLQRDDCMPANATARIKSNFQDQLAADDEAVFRMNYVRTRVESHEDMAQEALEAKAATDDDLTTLRRYFADPAYQGALVNDQTDLFEGAPRYRVNPLDPPTPWELSIARQVIPNS